MALALRRLAGLFRCFLLCAHGCAILELADGLIGTADDVLAFLETGEHLEVPLTRDTNLYGAEGDFVVGADDEDTLDIPLADFLRRRPLGERERGIGLDAVLPHCQRDDRNRERTGPRLGDDLRGRGEIRTRLGWRVQELDRDLVV